jgi:diguanylate cyclase (GGDEF)-like protein
MKDLSKTWRTLPEIVPPPPPTGGAMLVHLYPAGPDLGSCHSLGDAPLVIGRTDECDVAVNHVSVSRRHAHIERSDDGYYVADLESTNGTYVNDTRVVRHKLTDGDRLRIGSVIYRFLSGGNVEAHYHEEIYRLTVLDGLTEIHNKRYLLEFLERELARSTRYHRPLALALFDVDHFKQVNDRWGHLAGDAVLRELAALVKGTVRQSDLLARFAGEEFVLVLPETTREQAAGLSERLRQLVERHDFVLENRPQRITISIGVAALTGEAPLTVTALLQEADDKLYQAKNGGRNRVVD